MRTITSKDGTTIAFDQYGSGPAVILVGGALQHRAFDPGTAKLAGLLAPHFSVYHYDRRGRGDSGDTLPYAIEREIEDIDALIDDAGGSASLFGMSSGGALALQAALKLGAKVRKLAIYEVPYNSDPVARKTWVDYTKNLNAALAAGNRGDAAALFLKLVGMPDAQVAGMRQAPVWAGFEAAGKSLAYDAAVMGAESAIPADWVGGVTTQTLLITGGATFPFMLTGADELAQIIPNATRKTLEGQTHAVEPTVLAPVLIEFFK